MAKLKWDDTGERVFETGVSNGVLFPKNGTDGAYAAGVAWNGLTAISENPSGAEETPLYADNIKYLSLTSKEEYGATIEAYTYPDEFAVCDGTAEIADGVFAGQQARVPFGLVYTTLIGNDVDGDSHGKKIHIVYGAKAAPSARAYATVNDTPEAITFSWEITTTPVELTGLKPTAILVVDSRTVPEGKMAELEALLYGTADDEPTLPLPADIITLIGTTSEG